MHQVLRVSGGRDSQFQWKCSFLMSKTLCSNFALWKLLSPLASARGSRREHFFHSDVVDSLPDRGCSGHHMYIFKLFPRCFWVSGALFTFTISVQALPGRTDTLFPTKAGCSHTHSSHFMQLTSLLSKGNWQRHGKRIKPSLFSIHWGMKGLGLNENSGILQLNSPSSFLSKALIVKFGWTSLGSFI